MHIKYNGQRFVEPKDNSMLRIVVTGFLVFISFSQKAQTLDDIYTTWAKDNIPVAHNEITKVVKKIWGEDQSRAAPLIELHCKSLNLLLTKIQTEGVNQELLLQALTKWTEAPEDRKSQQWWEWPDTNWMRVQSEYESLLKNAN